MADENAARTVEPDGQNDQGTSDNLQQQAAKGGGKRERSSIAFPYNPLDDAVEIARAIHDHVGAGDCDDAQLSAWLDQSSKSSGYRMQLTAARMFGVLDPTSDRRKLTPLGRAIVDPRQERGARADAFLKVPLYAGIYERHKDGVLPAADGLETEIVSLGVAEKQKGRARQVFERSAQQAGYHEHGNNRLVRPGVAPLEARPPSEEHGSGGGGSGGGGTKPTQSPPTRSSRSGRIGYVVICGLAIATFGILLRFVVGGPLPFALAAFGMGFAVLALYHGAALLPTNRE